MYALNCNIIYQIKNSPGTLAVMGAILSRAQVCSGSWNL